MARLSVPVLALGSIPEELEDVSVDESSLKDKRILVTGGARGMGRSHVEHLSAAGASVLIGDVRSSDGELVAAQLRSLGRDVMYLNLDVTREEDWTTATAHSRDVWGGLNGLVNNAGITGTWGGPEVEDLRAWTTTIDVNQTGAYLGIRHVVPLMRDLGGGAIVNVSSILGFIGDGDYFAYTATKGAIRSMTRAAALKYADDGIRVNAVCPGMVRTPMNERKRTLTVTSPILHSAEWPSPSRFRRPWHSFCQMTRRISPAQIS